MHSSRISLFYPLLLTIQWFVDHYELTYKLTAALLAGLFSFQMYRTARALNTNSNLAYLSAGYCMVSPQLTYFAAQYSKNLLGAIFFLWLIQVLASPGYVKKGALLLVNLFIHKLTAGISVLAVLLQPAAGYIRKKHIIFIGVASAAAVLVVWITPVLFDLQDLHREGMGLTTTFSWPSLTFVQTFGDLLDGPWLVDVIICNTLFIIALGILFFKYETKKNWLPVLTILTALTFPFLQWSLVGLSFRALMLFLILCPLLIVVLDLHLKRVVLSSVFTIILLCGIWSNSSYSYQKHDPPYTTYRTVARKVEALNNGNFELIIAHKALAEYITYKTAIDVLPWEPEYTVDTPKLWRICTGINRKSIQYFGRASYQEDLFIEITPNYSLIREDLWDLAMSNMAKEDPDYLEELLTWKNPHVKRPAYMMKYKKDESEH